MSPDKNPDADTKNSNMKCVAENGMVEDSK